MIKPSNSSNCIFLSLVLAACGLANPAYCATDAVENIERRDNLDVPTEAQLENFLSIARPRSPVTGTAKDIFLLREHKLFYLRFNSSAAYTNAAFSLSQKRSDRYAQGKLTLGANTLVADRYNINLNLNYSAVRYDRFPMLDIDSYGAGVGVSTYIGSFIVGANYQYNKYTEKALGDSILSVNVVSSFVTYVKPLTGRSGFFAHGSLGYAYGNPDYYNASTVSVSPALYYQLMKNVLVIGSLSWSKKNYRHYFPEIFSISRDDEQKGAGLKLIYRPRAYSWLTVSSELAYSTNNSNIDIFDVKSFAASGFLQMSVRF